MAVQPNPPASSEGFRMLDDFICDAIPGPDISTTTSFGRGENRGMQAVSEFVIRASHPALSKERAAALRALTNLQLLALVRNSGSELSPEELGAIREIAIERLMQDDEPFSERGRTLTGSDARDS